ncbi:MAG: ABC transporter ATP-binding protein [Candidatus Riflebacteria bacterium]|nr:ABC transporter ATP-binding protein [Candidatus Riflebacteria bacterium]
MAEPILEFVNVSKVFFHNTLNSDFSRRKEILSGINLKVERGEIYGFVGLNGAGKTTCIKIALGLSHSDSGEAKLFNAEFSEANLRRVGFSPEKPEFYEYLNAQEILDFSFRLAGIPIVPEKKQSLLETVKLWDDREKQISCYSKGMRQRLSIACAMSSCPELYILDEPSSGLDPLGRRAVKDILKELKKDGRTVFFSTHILADVNEICDRIGILHNGKMIFEGKLKDFNPSNEDLEERFVKLLNEQTP